jgi:MFS family permease
LSDAARTSDPYAPFRVPAFRAFLLGSFLATVGISAQSLAIGWEMYVRTDEALALGLLGLTQALPMILFTLPAGYLADVLDRRKVMILGLVGTTLTSLALAAFSFLEGPIALMYALLFLDATFLRLTGPARLAILPQLLPRELFESGVKWRTTLSHLSSVVGPALGGVIITFSLPAAYLFSALTTLGFIGLLLVIDMPESPRNAPGRMFAQVAEGLRFVWRRKIVLGAVSLDLFAVLLGGAVYLLPIFARDILRGGPFGMSAEQALGWLRAAPAAGSIAMALILAHRPPMRSVGRALFGSVAAFGAATIVFGVSRSFWLSWGMLFLTGFFDNVSVVVRHTLVQLATPNEMRGRVSAVNSMFIGSSNQLGGFESGVVAHVFGPVWSVVSGGIGTLVVVLAWMRLFPGLRRFRTFAELGKDEDG